MSSEKPITTSKRCKSDNCNKSVTAHGFCCACYYRKLRRGEIKRGQQSSKKKHRLSQINLESKMALCAECGIVKIYHRGQGQFRCAKEANSRSNQYKRAYRASRKIQLKSYCEICGTTEKLRYDHDHKTGKFRGTLCNTCNSGIGFLKDNPTLLRQAQIYLETRK